MWTDEFDFDLPEELIALRPARPRRAARLLVAQGEGISDSQVRDLGRWLSPDDLLVFNDTKVIPARLSGQRHRAGGTTGVAVEATLIGPGEGGAWRALARPGKRLAPGDRIDFGPDLAAEVMAKDGAEILLAFDRSGRDFDRALARPGRMPLPPYISTRRPVDRRDTRDYQTVFAARTGAVAAPTASLHFDRVLLEDLETLGIRHVRVTLHVGAGTFLPVTVDEIEAHRMHSERGEIGVEAAEAIRATMAAGGRVIPVGTTALRVLETAATGPRAIAPWAGETDIFIRPGHAFRVADGLMTNFHLPRSSLMMLVSALMGVENIRRIYAHAIAERYRFFSSGDASLLLPRG
jgi:S-adenosylmethionine:tRNA ribosyltransferase-isomerase